MFKKFRKSISVIIRTRNEERWIGHAIQSVIEFLPGCEIIIIDNKSVYETLMICQMFSKPRILNNVQSSYTKIKFAETDNYTPAKLLTKVLILLQERIYSYSQVIVLLRKLIIQNLKEV